jgi:hypothetical protein
LLLVVEHYNPVANRYEPYAQRAVPLWTSALNVGSGAAGNSGAGPYPPGDPGLVLFGSSADRFLLFVLAQVSVSKDDHDYAGEFSESWAVLECEMPAIWVDEFVIQP